MIAWGELPGEEVERIIAVYILGEERSDARRYTPSRGDHGIDLYAVNEDGSRDVYQIKKFHQALGPSGKKQVKASWDALIKYNSDKGFEIRNWYIVMPHNPTPEEEEWLQELTSGSTVREADWLGQSKIDLWACHMPEVEDYFCNGDRKHIQDAIAEMSQAAKIPDLRDGDALLNHLTQISGILDKADPCYAYNIQLLSASDERSIENISGDIPNLAYSFEQDNCSGQRIIVEIIEKYADSQFLAPIKVTTEFQPQTEGQKRDLQDLIDFGQPVINMPSKVMSQGVLLPFDGDSTNTTVSLFSNESERCENLIFINGDFRLRIPQSHLSAGQKGVRWSGEDATGVLSVILQYEHDGQNPQILLRVDCSKFIKQPVEDVKKTIDFLNSFLPEGGFEIYKIENRKRVGKVSDVNRRLALKEEIIESLKKLSGIVDDLAVMQAHTGGEIILMPGFDSDIDDNDLKLWHKIAQLLSIGTIPGTESFQSETAVREQLKKLKSMPPLLIPIKATIGSRSYHLGYCSMDFQFNPVVQGNVEGAICWCDYALVKDTKEVRDQAEKNESYIMKMLNRIRDKQ
ncbi:hypothetical protein PT279_07875 [Bifidobacterium sp. ESL0784]|uniref:hypothetical protein n=1 Tax=Bifidobacterium sp. ESL0784 TaxID=2983231 RepID=UPI0023F723D5|nr:hypothetical protein [Bifidobacterium sp. ESL0784]MDF7641501.1 hypothetical protein [Bifidobacterium sp. ESL0784]